MVWRSSRGTNELADLHPSSSTISPLASPTRQHDRDRTTARNPEHHVEHARVPRSKVRSPLLSPCSLRLSLPLLAPPPLSPSDRPRYMSGAKADAILARAEDKTLKRKKRKVKTHADSLTSSAYDDAPSASGSGAGGAGGGLMLVDEDGGGGWGNVDDEAKEDDAPSQSAFSLVLSLARLELGMD